MAWVPDSRYRGYLGPTSVTQPEGTPFEDWLHDLFAGITGFPGDMIRPSWQWTPAPRPDINTDWMAFGINTKAFDFTPAHVHRDTGDGYDIVQEHEIVEIICTFYGPNVDYNLNLLRRGIYIDQNRAAMRAAGVGLIETDTGRFVPEVFNERWWSRGDLTVILRREIRMTYPILNLLRAQGPIIANDFGYRIIYNEWDTARGGTLWDDGATIWDDDYTQWDRS